MSRAVKELNRRMLRARDAMEHTYAEPLDVPSLAHIAFVSEAHFIRTFKAGGRDRLKSAIGRGPAAQAPASFTISASRWSCSIEATVGKSTNSSQPASS